MNFAIEAISLMDRAPNPNAAKLFANWYLSKKGQAILSKIMDRNSRRIDVPVVRPDAKLSEERFRKMFKKDYQENQKYARKALSFAKEVLK